MTKKCECEYVEFENPTPKYGYKGVNVICKYCIYRRWGILNSGDE
jgi:hypothetical protein